MTNTPTWADLWPLFSSNGTSSVTCANLSHRKLGTDKAVGALGERDEMGFSFYNLTSALF